MAEEKRILNQKKRCKQHTVKISVTQATSEKVDTTVTTFLSEDLYGLKMIQRNDHARRVRKGRHYGEYLFERLITYRLYYLIFTAIFSGYLRDIIR
ncbi:hypothetical protein GCM10027442_48470 [Emticicia fontis]